MGRAKLVSSTLQKWSQGVRHNFFKISSLPIVRHLFKVRFHPPFVGESAGFMKWHGCKASWLLKKIQNQLLKVHHRLAHESRVVRQSVQRAHARKDVQKVFMVGSSWLTSNIGILVESTPLANFVPSVNPPACPPA